MKAITVKFVGATDNLPARVVASAEGVKSVTLTYHADRKESAEFAVARKLCNAYGWTGKLVSGHTREGVDVFVFIDSTALEI